MANDETGYYFSGPGCNQGRGPKPWTEQGDTGIGVLEMYRVQQGTEADDAQVVKDALAFALEHATDTQRWVFAGYHAGLAGYDCWIDVLRNGRADAMSMAYNAALWKEYRGYAVLFLQEARERLSGSADDLLAEATSLYQTIHDHLTSVAGLFPFQGLDAQHVGDQRRLSAAMEALQAARAAEARAVESIRAIVEAL